MSHPTFSREQRVKVDLSGLAVHGVTFSKNVREAFGTIVEETATEPATYLVELLFTFKGIKRVEVPADRIKAA